MLVLDREDTMRLLAECFRVAARSATAEFPSQRTEDEEADALLEYLDDGRLKHGFGARYNYAPEFKFPMREGGNVRQVHLHIEGSKGVFMTLATQDGRKYNWIVGFGPRVDDYTSGFVSNVFADWLRRLLEAARARHRVASGSAA